MNIRDLLETHITENGLCPGALSYDEWKTKRWLETRIGDQLVPIFPMQPIRDSLCKHDVHHILTGYDTTMRGEAELAGWELGSGGCHHDLLFWVDRISFAMIGLVAYPAATLRAIRRGLQCRNLFATPLSEIEVRQVDATRTGLGLA